MFEELETLTTVGSTSDYLRRYIPAGLPRAVLADAQEAGRGRHLRHWYSPPGQGLYMSFLFFPDWPVALAPQLNQIAALAITRSIRSFARTEIGLTVKLPNDVMIEGRKVAGILVETSTLAERICWGIIGIGVNLFMESFPREDFHYPPTSLGLEGIEVPHPRAFYDILKPHFEELYARVDKGLVPDIVAEFNSQLDRSHLHRHNIE